MTPKTITAAATIPYQLSIAARRRIDRALKSTLIKASSAASVAASEKTAIWCRQARIQSVNIGFKILSFRRCRREARGKTERGLGRRLPRPALAERLAEPQRVHCR